MAKTTVMEESSVFNAHRGESRSKVISWTLWACFAIIFGIVGGVFMASAMWLWEGGGNQISLLKNASIAVEKINANAKVVPNVNPGDEKQYVQALSEGVAEALGSTPPGVPGNLYLFSHSTDAPWNIIRFNAIFYLLKELEPGDKVIIFYQNRRYDYIVFDKTIAKPDDVSFLTNRYDAPVLTLQTCDPPGTLLNRLIIRAKLVSS